MDENVSKKVDIYAIKTLWDQFSENGKNRKGAAKKVAEQLGVAEVTVYKALKKIALQNLPGVEAGRKTKGMRADMIDGIVDALLEEWQGKKREFKGLRAGQIPMAIAVLIDKAAMLRNEATQKIEFVDKAKELEEKLKKIEAVRDTLLNTLQQNKSNVAE